MIINKLSENKNFLYFSIRSPRTKNEILFLESLKNLTENIWGDKKKEPSDDVIITPIKEYDVMARSEVEDYKVLVLRIKK